MYYPCSENKGADQLRGYREADLRLCFRIYKKSGFLMTWLIYYLVSGSDYEGSESESEEEVIGPDGTKVRRKKKKRKSMCTLLF